MKTFPKALMITILGTSLASLPVFAAQTSSDTHSASAGQKLDQSVESVGNFMDDSTLTARVKAALIDSKSVTSSDISVKTDNNVVTLSGFVATQDEATQAVNVAKNIDGVTSVSDKLHVRDGQKTSLHEYAGDAATTSKIKAKFLADDVIPSRHISVKTTDGVVLLTGEVESAAQAQQAESVAKGIEGVKSVKNEITVK